MFKICSLIFSKAIASLLLFPFTTSSQQRWINVDSLYQPLPSSVHVYRSTLPLDDKPFVGYYVEVPLQDKRLIFSTDTTMNRRNTPSTFFQDNDKPLLVVNATFFSFETNRILNLVIKNSSLIARNNTTIRLKGKDSLKFIHSFNSAIGIDRKGKADVAWVFTDSSSSKAFASQAALKPLINDQQIVKLKYVKKYANDRLHKWKMRTAIGGGPVLVQDGKMVISNEEERKFSGKAINDKHPRTAMGYTADGRLIIMAIQGRMPGIADGADLIQEAELLIGVGCVEALNLDGGGSSCLLVNGKETIKPSDKTGQRAVPAVFLVTQKY
ncbi:MAG: phosphodiester glycosidase family protein [Chitinophagaceae bacterium]